MEKWLLLYNCQTYGVGNSMQLLNPDITIDAVDNHLFMHNVDKFVEAVPTYSRMIIHPYFQRLDFDFSLAQNLTLLPSISFDAYHPDLCYAHSGAEVDGPMSVYHSTIVLAAYHIGLSIEATRKLFRRDVFEKCGFFDRWEASRSRLLRDFSEVGLDISSAFRRWSRTESFMYSLNHPKVQCLYDLARMFMQHLGVETREGRVLPPDNLVNGPCYPIYPEIGETLGVNGSYLFKVAGEYRLISLEKFIELSFATYASHPAGSIVAAPQFRKSYDKVKAAIVEAAVAA
ncbi:WcbI family polysaccharide biosynthesis putative acetyltransferase [Rhizobium rhizogenes]|uniref:WcbI family polysaccharide biosynthesis putative acetyltransferase n=1 Tax=Rhizobium rhizogenes TaxID=359 RepID=UPI002271A034|nr:WcbI family polysaccharide biosynthesis putative acetyltransferase [Rhizobium rhizogenes]